MDQTIQDPNMMGQDISEEQMRQIYEFEQQRQQYPFEIVFDSEKQKELAEVVLHDFQVSDESRKRKGDDGQSWEDKMKTIVEKWEGIRKPKSKPFKGCSNKTMRLATAIEQTMHAQMMLAIWNGGRVTFRPGEATDISRVKRTNDFMSWVVSTGAKLYDPLDDYIHSHTKLGTGIFKYAAKWDEQYVPKKQMDPATGAMVTEFEAMPHFNVEVIDVPIDALYFQPNITSVQGPQPIIHRIEYSLFEIEDAISKKTFLDVKDKLSAYAYKATDTTQAKGPIAAADEEADKRAKQNAKMRNYPLVVLEWYGLVETGDPRGPQECIIWVEEKSKTYLSGKLLRSIYPRNKRPFIAKPCIKRNTDVVGIGYVELVYPLADEVDALYNQANDMNTLDVMPGGFYSPTSGMDPDKVELGPNVWLPVENPVQNVYMPSRQHNTEKFVMMIRSVMEFVERLTAASSYLMGKEDALLGGTGSATRTTQIVAHAETRLGPVLRRIASGWTELLTELYYLFYMYAPPGYAERVIGEDGTQLFPSLTLQDSFLNEADCYCNPDIMLASAQAQKELAMWVYQNFSQHPLVMADIRRLWEVAHIALEANSNGTLDIEAIIGPKPGSNIDMTLVNIENTRMIQGEMLPVNPTDIDIQHINGHTMLLQSRELPEEVKQIIGAHIMAHQQKLEAIVKKTLGIKEEAPNGTGGQGQKGTGV